MDIIWLEQSLADVPSDDAWLSSAERSHCFTLRVPKRRTDWRLGRWTAKRAIACRMDLPQATDTLATIEIRPDASGAPEVLLHDRPPGFGISISHSAGLAACAVGPTGAAVGCDLEVVEARDPAFIADYFTSGEQRLISHAGESDRGILTNLLWSAKESALKTLRTGLRLDTRCVEAKISADSFPIANSWAPLSVCCPDDQVLQGWWRYSGRHVRTLLTVPSSATPVVVAVRSYG